MEYKTIRVEDADKGIARLVLNRPEAKNALSVELRREMSSALAALKEDKSVRALIICGAGGAFCAGFDLKEFMKPEMHNDIFESSAAYHRDVWNFPKPVIAAIAGVALGGGFDLATLCDVRVCADNAKFGHPEIKFGGPPLFTPLRWIVGHGIARELCLTGRNFGADEALRIGLVSEVVAPDALDARALEIARTIIQAPADALAITKHYMANAGGGFEESFVAEHDDVFKRTLLKKQ